MNIVLIIYISRRRPSITYFCIFFDYSLRAREVSSCHRTYWYKADSACPSMRDTQNQLYSNRFRDRKIFFAHAFRGEQIGGLKTGALLKTLGPSTADLIQIEIRSYSDESQFHRSLLISRTRVITQQHILYFDLGCRW